METQDQNPIQPETRDPITENREPTADNRQPTTDSVPWLKYAEIFFVILAIVNLGLFYFYLSSKKSALPDKLVGTEDSQGFLLTKPDQTISREGYLITFSNPRYEYLDLQSEFRVDVELKNESIKPSINVVANCDIAENGEIVSQGVGVSVESGEAGEVFPATSRVWTALVILENKTQKVSSCLYAPEGIFDPKQTIRVVF